MVWIGVRQTEGCTSCRPHQRRDVLITYVTATSVYRSVCRQQQRRRDCNTIAMFTYRHAGSVSRQLALLPVV